MPEVSITGIGITTAVGQGRTAFAGALMRGDHAFGLMERPGRQKGTEFIGAEIPEIDCGDRIDIRLKRTAGLSALAAIASLDEAWKDARLDEVPGDRIGLIIGGSNIQQREQLGIFQSYAERPTFIRPTYAITFLDTDLCGLCAEVFGIKGPSHSLGGASASGQLAVIQAMECVASGKADVCIAVGALMDLSYLEFQALRNVGAMGSDRFAKDPASACRPFDRSRDGFIYGEACGVVVVESRRSAAARQVPAYGIITGSGTAFAGSRNPNPDEACEIEAIRRALADAGLSAADIDYINPHGSGSSVGDMTELNAIEACGLSHAYINATKSITGHGLSAAGAVEVIATLIQMEADRLHPTRNLVEPERADLNWVTDRPVDHRITNALCLSYGFSGINTALCLRQDY